jgi:hypothetical protein
MYLKPSFSCPIRFSTGTCSPRENDLRSVRECDEQTAAAASCLYVLERYKGGARGPHSAAGHGPSGDARHAALHEEEADTLHAGPAGPHRHREVVRPRPVRDPGK